METVEKTSRQKMLDHFKSRTKELQEYLDNIEEHDSAPESLCVMERIEKNVQLSWGGPSDGYKIYFDQGDPVCGVYYFADWGTYDEVDLNDEEVSNIVDLYGLAI